MAGLAAEGRHVGQRRQGAGAISPPQSIEAVVDRVEPKLLAEIEYRAKSAEGKVRHPFFKGLRDDLGESR
jgi:ATP-dependent DNA ligase